MSVSRRDLLKSVGLGAAAISLSSNGIMGAIESLAAADDSGYSRKPNVVVILCDQLRSFSVGCYGNEFVHTPNIDKIAQGGYRFEHGITNSPVCVPARSNILTGQHARTCVGSRTNEMSPGTILGRSDRCKFPDITLAEAMKSQGYKTSQIGKWHMDTKPSLLGFDESLVVNRMFTKGTFIENEGKEFDVPGFTCDYELLKAKQFIKANKSNPFFLYYNIVPPHMPLLDIPYKYSRMYDAAKLPLRANVWKDGKLPSDEKWFQIYMWQHLYNDKIQPITAKASPEFTIHDLTALYYGAVTWADDLVGELIRSLEEENLDKDTIIILTSDHGDMLGSHHRWNKDCLYEEAIRIPMIYSWPGRISKGYNNKQVTSLIDIMPTLLELCGGKTPKTVQGISMADILRGTNNTECVGENCAFIETPFAELGIRTPTHLYGVVMDPNDRGIAKDRNLFFDLQTDPYQQKNLADLDQSGSLANQLREKLFEWDKQTPRLNTIKYKPWQEI